LNFLNFLKNIRDEIVLIAKNFLGFSGLRDGILKSTEIVLQGHNLLSVLPTGYGKSTIYHIASLVFKNPILVISPLISLQKDQSEKIKNLKLGRSEVLNSLLKKEKQIEILKDFSEKKINFLFLAPEQLTRAGVLEMIKLANPSLVVVDEAHSVSEWGHDFRPDFRKLGSYIEFLNSPQILALTATASPPIQKDIISQLRMKDSKIVVDGFDRPNIFLEVLKCENEEDKLEKISEKLKNVEFPGIIYVGKKDSIPILKKFLEDRKFDKIEVYHGSLGKKRRTESQDNFMNGSIKILIATNAFGLGIDHPNIRFIFHFQIPDSVDRYFQEVGRGGRDGKKTIATLFYDKRDLNLSRFFKGKINFKPKDIKNFLIFVRENSDILLNEKLLYEIGLEKAKAKKIAEKLSDAGVLRMDSEKKVFIVDEKNVKFESYKAYETQNFLRHFESSRVQMIEGYAENLGCRRKYILNYFGENFSKEFCENCDNCLRRNDVKNDENLPFEVGSKVLHFLWGIGQVVRYENDKIIILFEKVGYKKLFLEHILKEEILKKFETSS